MSKVWYLQDCQQWATAGSDFKLYLWDIKQTSDHAEYQVSRPLSLHYDEITDCVEIKEPKCLCTCSMDRSIVMYDAN